MKRRRAFTLVEMLVVIGIIAVLVGLAVLAYSHLDKAASGKTTRANLQLVQGFLDEFNAGPGLAKLGYVGTQPDPSFPYVGGCFGPAGIPSNSPNPIGVDTSVLAEGVAPGGGLDRDPAVRAKGGPPILMYDYPPKGGGGGNGGGPNAVYNTAIVMMSLERVTAIKDAASRVPTQLLLPAQVPVDSGNPGGSTVQQALTINNNGTQIAVPVVLDGWKNPIIFVPAGGLVVYISGGTNPTTKAPISEKVLVRSSGVIPNYAGGAVPLKDNDHPFWASAGPDGNFSGDENHPAGDDNIYSFQQ